MPVPASTTMQTDTSPESRMKVIREIDFFKRIKAAAAGGLSPSSFKDGVEVFASELKTSETNLG